MWDRLKLVTAPADTPLSVEDLKSHSRVDNGEEDAILSEFIDRAVGLIDGPRGIGHCMMVQTWRLALDCFPCEIVIPLGPVASLTSIKYLDTSGVEQTLASNQYWANLDRDQARVIPAYGVAWPAHRAMPGSVKIEFVAGYASADTVPAALRAATAALAAHLYENREAVVLGTNFQPFEIPTVATCLANFRGGVVA